MADRKPSNKFPGDMGRPSGNHYDDDKIMRVRQLLYDYQFVYINKKKVKRLKGSR